MTVKTNDENLKTADPSIVSLNQENLESLFSRLFILYPWTLTS